VNPRVIAASETGVRVSIPRLLFALLGAPILWALHLLVCYFLVTLDCITPWDGAVGAVIVATAAGAAGSVAAGRVALGIRRGAGSGQAGDARHWLDFLALLGIGGSVLFTAVIVLTGVAPLLTRLCP